jgi:hypothetical protein
MLRQFAGPTLEQTVMWSLLVGKREPGAPPLDDLPLVESALGEARGDAALFAAIDSVMRDGRPTVCFCRHLATAIALARHLGQDTAWVTGSAAGIGPHRLARDQVLAAFGPQRATWSARRTLPIVLVTTEVVSEGLDLQGASRIVHVDVPWHPARHAQRIGRIARIGQLAPGVEEVIRPIAPAIERRLRLLEGFRRKHRWSAAWLAALEHGTASARHPVRATWCATVEAAHDATIALVHLVTSARAGTIALTYQDRRWQPCPEPPRLPARIDVRGAAVGELRHCRRLARQVAWQALAMARVPYTPNGRIVAELLQEARRRRAGRDTTQLRDLDALLALVARPLSLGQAWHLEAHLTTGIAGAAGVARTDPPAMEAPRIAWIALVHFATPGGPLR